MSAISAEDIRTIIGLDYNEAPDEEIEPHIEISIKECLGENAIRVLDEEISGTIDGINNKFTTAHSFIADSNFDGVIDSSDIDVYGWLDYSDPLTKVKLDVQSVDGRYGIIVLTTSPDESFKKITCDYWYYREYPDPTLMKNACAVLCAYKFVLSYYLLIPIWLSHGALRYRIERPYEQLRIEYERIKELAFSSGRAMLSATSHSQEITMIRGDVS